MMEDVVISIRSEQYGSPDEQDSVDFVTDGLYMYDDGVGCLSYMESEVTGLEGTRTSVMVMPDKVVVDRDGMITSRMIFQEGSKHSFQYNTPYGMATLSMNTRHIFKDFNADGGQLKIDYVVGVEHAVVSRNLFRLTVSKQKQVKLV